MEKNNTMLIDEAIDHIVDNLGLGIYDYWSQPMSYVTTDERQLLYYQATPLFVTI
jgi:hypothetical protein